MFKAGFGRKAVAGVSAVSLSAGLILQPVLQESLMTKVHAAEEKAQDFQLEEGTYVEGEVLAYVVDEDTKTYQAKGGDLLSNSEELMEVESGMTDPNESDSQNQKPVKGSIELIKSDSKSTRELLKELENDPRVLYAEPNYIVTASEDDSKELNSEANAEQDNISDQEQTEKNRDDQSSAVKELRDPEPADELDQQKGEEEKQDESSVINEQESSKPESESVSEQSGQTNWGPDGFDENQIPDMTAWQWANYNNGYMSGSYQHEGSVDTQYNSWKSQEKEDLKEYVVGVMDTGIDENNPDLAGVLWTGESFGEGGDSHGFYSNAAPGQTSTTGLNSNHGSHVAGIIASEWNGQGTSGTASNVKLMSLRFADSYATAIQALQYAKLAVENGVNLIAINCSWGMGLSASNLINTAVTELGELGVVTVFAAGNSASNLDRWMDTGTTLANNPYAINVNSLGPDGNKSIFTNYGIATTDVFAPGSAILSTTINHPRLLQFLGEVNAHAPQGSEARRNLVSYTSFDEESINPFDTFAVYTDEDGTQLGSDCEYPVDKPAEGSFDGTGVLSVQTNESGQAGITSSTMDLSDLEQKPRYVSFRAKDKDNESITYAAQVGVPVVAAFGEGDSRTIEVPLGMTSDNYLRGPNGSYGCIYVSLEDAEQLSEADIKAGITEKKIDWENFRLSLFALSSSGKSGTIYFDSIALGSGRYPYVYMNGTSMAAPAAVGVLSVIAGQYEDQLGTPGTAEFAEKLASLVKGASVPDPQLEQLCATSGYVSVEGAKNPGPVMISVADGKNEFTVTGYFMNNVVISLDGEECTFKKKSLGNDKYELTVEKPAGYQGGSPVITAAASNGKMDRIIVSVSSASGEAGSELFDHPNIPVPEEMSKWHDFDLVGFNGLIYVLPRAYAEYTYGNPDSIFAYDPESGEWSKIIIPIESLTINGEQLLSNVESVTGCVKDGKLFLLICGDNKAAPDGLEVLAALDSNGNWETLAYGYSAWSIPKLGTLSTDGENLYLFGGNVKITDESGVIHALGCQTVYQLESNEIQQIVPKQVAKMAEPRSSCHVSYSNGKFLVSGGNLGNDKTTYGVPGAETIVIGGTGKPVDVESMLNHEKNLSFASGGLADGSFLLTGPVSKNGTADTYILDQEGNLSEFEKRAYSGNMMMPAALAYNGNFYVLAAIAPSGLGNPTLTFSSTAVNADVPKGDALIRTIETEQAKTSEGMPSFENKEILVSQKDLYSNLGNEATEAIFNINNAKENSTVYLEVNKKAEAEVPEPDRSAVKAEAAAQKLKDELFWMDAAMYLQIPGQERIQLHTNEAGVQITVGIPEFAKAQKEASRSYKIFAYHADAAKGEQLEVIDPEYDEKNQTLTFNIHRCSTYAIGYAEEPNPTPEPTPDPAPTPTPTPGNNDASNNGTSSNGTSNTTTSVPSSSTLAASSTTAATKTSVGTNAAVWMVVLSAGCALLILPVVLKKKRK